MTEQRKEPPFELVGQTLEIDDTEALDAESAVTDELHGPASTSSTSQVTEYSDRHGRRYHAFDEDAYWLPNDDIEIKRLGIQHHVWRLTLNGKLCISPIPNDVQDVVDIGTGAGQWAIEFADSHPTAHVIGTDLSPIQPAWRPQNCTFLVQNAETEWEFDRKFDFVHSRMLLLGIHDWPNYFKQAWDNLKPGGWVEVQEVEYPIRSADETNQTDSPLWKFLDYVRQSAAKGGIDTTVAPKFKDLLLEQGFVNIKVEPVKWPIGTWPKGKKEKNIGKWTRENTKQFITPVAKALFTKNLGWSMEQAEAHLVEVRKDVEDWKKHFYWQMYLCSAQKPEKVH